MEISHIASPDAWVSGLGSFLGALLAGVVTGAIAIYIMRVQLKNNSLAQEKIDLQNFVKAYKLLIIYGEAISLKAPLFMSEEYVIDEIGHINELNKLKQHMNVINQINHDYIPEEIYSNFLFVIETLNKKLEIIEKSNKDKLHQLDFLDAEKHYEEARNDIKSYGEIKVKQLYDLNKK